MRRSRFRSGYRRAHPPPLTPILESPASSNSDLLKKPLLPPANQLSSHIASQFNPSPRTAVLSLSPSRPRSASFDHVLPYSALDKFALTEEEDAAMEHMEEELKNDRGRAEELRHYVDGIIEKLSEKKGKIDPILLNWREKWLDLYRESSKTDYALKVIKGELRAAEDAVERGEKLIECRLLRYRRNVKLQYQPRKLYATKPLWREAEVRSLVSHLLSMLSRNRTDQAERNPDRFLSGEEVARSEAVFDWSQDLEVTLLYYLKQSTDPRKRWIQVKLELKRLELLSRNPIYQALMPTSTPLFSVGNVLARIKSWKVPSNLASSSDVRVSQLSSLSKIHRRELLARKIVGSE